MSSFNNFLERALLDHVWGDDSYTAPNPIWVGLSTTAIAEDGSGITEPTDGYERQSVVNNLTNFPAASTDGADETVKTNGEPIEFPTATGNWGEVTHFFFANDDAGAVGEEILAYGVLDTAKTIQDGDTATFAVDAIEIYLD